LDRLSNPFFGQNLFAVRPGGKRFPVGVACQNYEHKINLLSIEPENEPQNEPEEI
jgi:hypothetical protein